MDYIENQCAKTKESERTCDYVEYENTDLGFADLQVDAESKDEVILKERLVCKMLINAHKTFYAVPATLR